MKVLPNDAVTRALCALDDARSELETIADTSAFASTVTELTRDLEAWLDSQPA